MEEAAAERLQAQTNKNHYVKKLAEEQANVNQVEEVAKVLQQEFEVLFHRASSSNKITKAQNWTAGAEEYCERVPDPRDAAVVQRNLESVQTALKERERR